MMEKYLIRAVYFIFIGFLLRWNFYCDGGEQVSIILNERIFDQDDSINIGFSFFEFEQAKDREREAKVQYDLTAILLHWNESEDIKKTLKYLVKSNVFKEIIVWNNNPHTNVTIDHLIKNIDSEIPIRLIHSKENIRNLGIYYACIESTGRACFYVDHRRKHFPYLKSMASSFRSAPSLLHLISNYSTSRSDLYNEILVNSYGRVFLREYVQGYVQILNKYMEHRTGKKKNILNKRRFDYVCI